jgi:hypothetical protein
MTRPQFGSETEGMKNLNQATADQGNGTMPMSMAVAPRNSTTETLVMAQTAIDEAKAEGKAISTSDQEKNRAYFRSQIALRWNQAFKAIIGVCRLIVEARIHLSAEEFKLFIQEDCPFDYSVIKKFEKIGLHPGVNDPANEPHMPNTWTVLYELCLMNESTFRRGIQLGIIHPNSTLADLKKLRKLDPPKRKPTKKAAQTGSSSANRKPEPKPSSTPAKTETSTSESATAVVKAPVNTLGFHVVESTAKSDSDTPNATAPEFEAAPTITNGRIVIVLTKALIDRDEKAVKQLKGDIEALVSKYAFIGGVELEVAA